MEEMIRDVIVKHLTQDKPISLLKQVRSGTECIELLDEDIIDEIKDLLWSQIQYELNHRLLYEEIVDFCGEEDTESVSTDNTNGDQ